VLNTKVISAFWLIHLGMFTAAAQSNAKPADSLADTKKWDVSIDMVSRYVWRGQLSGDNMAVQPAFNYACTDKITFMAWATTNF
jgi:hypothetical protein